MSWMNKCDSSEHTSTFSTKLSSATKQHKSVRKARLYHSTTIVTLSWRLSTHTLITHIAASSLRMNLRLMSRLPRPRSSHSLLPIFFACFYFFSSFLFQIFGSKSDRKCYRHPPISWCIPRTYLSWTRLGRTTTSSSWADFAFHFLSCSPSSSSSEPALKPFEWWSRRAYAEVVTQPFLFAVSDALKGLFLSSKG